MKKLIRKSLIVFIIVAMFTMTACNKSDAKSSFQTGSFNEKEFTNEWSNIRFEFPEDYIISSQDEIKALVAQGNNDLLTYDFFVQNADSTVHFLLAYEDLAKSEDATKLDEKSYIENALKSAFEDESLAYKKLKEEKVTIAEKEFLKYSLSVLDGVVMQDIYCHKIDDRMMVLSVTYAINLADEAADIMTKISTVK